MGWLVTLCWFGLAWLLVVVVGPSAVGDGRVGAVPEFGLPGAGAEGGSDVGPGGSVRVGLGGEHGDHAFGLVDEAGEQGDGGDGVAGPSSAAFGELVEGAVDQVVGVVAAARRDGGHGFGHGVSPWSWLGAGMRPRSRFLSR